MALMLFKECPIDNQKGAINCTKSTLQWSENLVFWESLLGITSFEVESTPQILVELTPK